MEEVLRREQAGAVHSPRSRGRADHPDPVRDDPDVHHARQDVRAERLSALFQGRAAAAACDAQAETGQGLTNYFGALGIVETVAIFTMVFTLIALGKIVPPAAAAAAAAAS